jgi:hypothetical protein
MQQVDTERQREVIGSFETSVHIGLHCAISQKMATFITPRCEILKFYNISMINKQ